MMTMIRDVFAHILNRKEVYGHGGYQTRWEYRWLSCEANKSWWGDARLWTIFHEYGIAKAGTTW